MTLTALESNKKHELNDLQIWIRPATASLQETKIHEGCTNRFYPKWSQIKQIFINWTLLNGFSRVAMSLFIWTTLHIISIQKILFVWNWNDRKIMLCQTFQQEGLSPSHRQGAKIVIETPAETLACHESTGFPSRAEWDPCKAGFWSFFVGNWLLKW